MPTLETKRLILRRIAMRDAKDVFAYSRDEEVARQIRETVSLLDGSYSAVLTIDRVYVPQTT